MIGGNELTEMLADKERIEALRELLRDVHDVAVAGEKISEGLLDRIRREMANGNRK